MLMQPTVVPIDQFPNLASIIDELQEDDCSVYVEHLKAIKKTCNFGSRIY